MVDISCFVTPLELGHLKGHLCGQQGDIRFVMWMDSASGRVLDVRWTSLGSCENSAEIDARFRAGIGLGFQAFFV